MRWPIWLAALGALTAIDFTVSTPAFPQTTQLLHDLAPCPASAQSDIDCLSTSKSGLVRAQKLVNDIHTIRTQLETLKSSLETIAEVLVIVDFIPEIGEEAVAFEEVINEISDAVDNVINVVAKIDNFLVVLKPKIDSILADIAKAIPELQTIKKNCLLGYSYVSLSIGFNCIPKVTSASVNLNLASNIETFSKKVDPNVLAANQAMSNLGNTCNVIRIFANLPWPDVGFIAGALTNLEKSISPILNALQAIQKVLDQSVCLNIKSPQEVASEVVELGTEAVNRAQELASEAFNRVTELAREAAEKPAEWFPCSWCGWGRRKRSTMNLQEISQSRQDAHILIKRQWCVSVGDVLKDINGVLNIFNDPVNALLGPLLKNMPSFSLPGLPNFSILLAYSVNIIVPNLNLGLQYPVIDAVAKLDWKCPIAVKASCINILPYALVGTSSFPCTMPISG